MLRLEDVETISVYNQNQFNQVSMMEGEKKKKSGDVRELFPYWNLS